ncbi:MAG: type II toxin-antitoxin system VapC family toxin [Candidatus Binatia bacterium]
MNLVDANILLYAYHPRSEHHDASRAWLESAIAGSEPLRMAWITILAFLRISTSPRVFEHPLTSAEAREHVTSWLELPGVDILEPAERYWGILAGLLETGQVAGALVMDAALAALAIEHGATLCTTDRDFDRFDGLKVLDPLNPIRRSVKPTARR